MIPDRFFALFDAIIDTKILFIQFGIVALFLVIEHVRPAKPISYRGHWANVKVAVICGALLSPILAIYPSMLAQDFVGYVKSFFPYQIPLDFQSKAYTGDDINITPLFPLPKLIMYTFAGLFIADFFAYWTHRIMHNTWLWEIHKVHHSDRHFSALTTLRGHPLTASVLSPMLIIPAGILLNVTVAHAVIYYYIQQTWIILTHVNLPISFGWLTPVVTSPQLHRLHHSIEPQHQNKNYAGFFPIWDIIFGTYYAPKKGEFPETGVKGEATNPTWRELFYEPFRGWVSGRVSAMPDAPQQDPRTQHKAE